MPSSHWLQFIGGLTFFFFGLFSMHEGLIFFAGDRLKNLIARTTQGPIRSFLTGIVVTFFLQSSSAVTVMTVGLTSSGLLSLRRAMGVALGAGIGTTFVILLISIKSVVDYGILVIVLGMIIRFLSKKKKFHIIGRILYGLGFVFFGLATMSQATAPLQTESILPQVFVFMQQYPIANFLVAALITALIHSSAVILGILVSLAFTGIMGLETAIPLILGANVGTAFTALTVSLGAKTEGKRLAWANLFMRLGAAMIIALFLKEFLFLFNQGNHFFLVGLFNVPLTPYTQIALFHLFFNIAAALFFLPLMPLGERLMVQLFPTRPDEKESFGSRYLDRSALSTPPLALAQVNRELIRMGEIVQTMFKKSLKLFEKYDLDLEDTIRSKDHQVDTLYREIKFFLAQLSVKDLEDEDANSSMYLMRAVNEMENIGDMIDVHIIRLAQKKWKKITKFSNEGWKEICQMHRGTEEMLGLCLSVMTTSNQTLALKMANHHTHYAETGDQLKMTHLKRLSEGKKDTIDSSAIHLELLSLYHRMNLSLMTIAGHLLPDRDYNHVRKDDED